MSPRRILLSVLLITMLSAAVRAFGTSSVVRYAPRSFAVVRSMSTTGEPDTSVVATCQEKIQAALDTSNVKVTGACPYFEKRLEYFCGLYSHILHDFILCTLGAYDDPNGSHISIEVVSPKFEGKRAVQRQQMVYKAIWEELQGPVHAVDAMVCKTPDEA